MDVKKLRKDKGMTLMDLAQAVGVSMNTIILWEREISKPNPENMKKLMEVLEVKEWVK